MFSLRLALLASNVRSNVSLQEPLDGFLISFLKAWLLYSNIHGHIPWVILESFCKTLLYVTTNEAEDFIPLLNLKIKSNFNYNQFDLFCRALLHIESYKSYF